MKRITVGRWLVEHGPCTSGALRTVMGVTAKGTPIAGHLATLAREGFAKKKASAGGNVYTITAKGKTWAANHADGTESVEEINGTVYEKGVTRAKAQLPNTETEERAIDGIVGVIEENKRLRAALRRIHLELGTLLGE